MNNKKKLQLDEENKMILGVCAGLAKHYDQDVSMVRIIAAVILFVTGFSAGVAYLVAWFILKEQTS